MGCSSSHEEPPKRLRCRVTNRTVNPPGMIPRPRRDTGKLPIAVAGRLRRRVTRRTLDPPGMVSRPRRDAGGAPIVAAVYDINREIITVALEHVAEYLHSHGQALLIVAVGGAVNTVLLRTRQMTHDVNFFNTAFSASGLSTLQSAVEHVEEQFPLPLGNRWLNNEAGTIVGTAENSPQLVEMAREQDEVVFRARGLTVLAALLDYSLMVT